MLDGSSVHNQHLISHTHFLIKLDYVEIAHEHTAGTQWFAEARFLIGAMNVNISVMGIDLSAAVYAGFEAAQPEDAAGDKVGIGVRFRQFGIVPTGGNTRLEDHADRLAGADAFGNFMQAPWGAEGVLNVGRRSLGSGYRITFHQIAMPEELEGLGADAHHKNPLSGLDAEAQARFVGLFPRRITREQSIHQCRYRRRH